MSRGGAVRALGSGACALSLMLALPAAGAEPRSAIPWLSQSIEIEDTPPPPSRPRDWRTAPDDTITVTPLGAVSRDGVGLLPPSATGFAPALWGRADATAVAAMIDGHPDQGVPAARALFHRMLLAEADPPPGGGPASPVLLARIDRLLAIGALAEARALIERAGPETPELFRRWFDVGLLLDDAAEPCAALRQNPSLSPTLPARVFCLARGGDWNAAEITLTLGQQVGSIDADQQALLARFLDPVLFEEEPEPPIPEPLTALDFLMREAVGLPRPPGPLPLAFLHMDLGEHVPMRMRAEAAERLVLAGAVGPQALFAAYRAGEPAASGGVWDRAQAVQALDAALAPEGTGFAKALVAADRALSDRGLRVALAQAYGVQFAALDPAEVDADVRLLLAELLLLSGETTAAARVAAESPSPGMAGMLAVAGDGPPPASDTGPVAMALAGLDAPAPTDERERALAAKVAEGRQGEALLEALALVQGGGKSLDPPALRAALMTLRLAGQEPAARAIALEVLLAGPVA